MKPLVLIVAYNYNFNYLLDLYDSILFYNNCNLVFAIDNNNVLYEKLIKKLGKNKVFITSKKNGGKNGILKTIVESIEFFNNLYDFNSIITLDSDIYCIGNFVDKFLSLEKENTYFIGQAWEVPLEDYWTHYYLYYKWSVFTYGKYFTLNPLLIAGPCMFWTENALNLFKDNGLYPISELNKVFPYINFHHDQITSYFHSLLSIELITNTDFLFLTHSSNYKMKYSKNEKFGSLPIVNESTTVIHPSGVNEYNVRKYYRELRTNSSEKSLQVL